MPLPPSRLTHIALQVGDVERTVAFYRRFTQMQVVHERADSRTGSRVVWMRERSELGPLTIVVFQAQNLARPDVARPVHHLGFAVETRQAVDTIAARGEEEGIVVLPATDYGDVVGYICEVADPDGNVLEFSHGQAL